MIPVSLPYEVTSRYYDFVFETSFLREWNLGIISLIDRVFPRNAKVLDLACGTGLGAKALNSIGLKNIHGSDASVAMLKYASRSGLYSSLKLCSLPAISSAPQQYDIVCCGLDSLNYLKPAALPEFFRSVSRVLKPTGLFAFDCMTLESSRVASFAYSAGHGSNILKINQDVSLQHARSHFYFSNSEYTVLMEKHIQYIFNSLHLSKNYQRYFDKLCSHEYAPIPNIKHKKNAYLLRKKTSFQKAR